jgi:hypothetical protein
LNNIEASFTDTTQGRIYRGIGTNSLTKMHVNNLTQLPGLQLSTQLPQWLHNRKFISAMQHLMEAQAHLSI